MSPGNLPNKESSDQVDLKIDRASDNKDFFSKILESILYETKPRVRMQKEVRGRAIII